MYRRTIDMSFSDVDIVIDHQHPKCLVVEVSITDRCSLGEMQFFGGMSVEAVQRELIAEYGEPVSVREEKFPIVIDWAIPEELLPAGDDLPFRC